MYSCSDRLKKALGDIHTDVLAFDIDQSLGMPTLAQLGTCLAETSYNLLHIVSHGKVEKGETILYWAKEENKVEPVKGSHLQEKFQELGTTNLPYFIFLSVCETAKSEAGMAFSGLAQEMFRELKIPAVLAMTDEIKITTAEALSGIFYPKLLTHGEVDRALSEASSILNLADEVDDIVVPGLFSQLGNTPLFVPQPDPEELRRNNKIPSSGLENGEQLKSFSTPVQNIPRSGARRTFVGRSKELEMLHEYLQKETDDIYIVIVGMAGVGKTELAIQYAQKYWKFYPGGVCWLNARASNIGTQIIEFVQSDMELSVPQKKSNGKRLKRRERVDWCWRNWKPSELPILVIIDDVTDFEVIKPYLPSSVNSRFKVLITTRKKWLPQSFEKLDLKIFDETTAMELLKIFLGVKRIEKESRIAKELCEWLGYLPLGLELVSRYLQRKEGLSLKVLLKERLKKEGLEHKSLQKTKFNSYMTALWNIEGALKFSWQELDTEAKQLGCLLSLFALSPIPWCLVELCFPEQKPETLEDIRDDSLINLNLLLFRDTNKNAYQLHPLIREFLQKQLEESDWANSLKQKFCQVMSSQAQKIPQSPTQNLISEFTMYVPHIVEVATTLKDWLSDEDFCFPFVGLGRFYAGQGIYDEAEKWYNKYE